MDAAEVRRRVGEARVGHLATVDPAGRPHVVPVVFVLEGDTVYSAVDRKPKRTPRLQRVRNLLRDPRATLLVDHYEEDWSRLWWARGRGRARVIEEGPELHRALELLARKYPQHRQEPPPGPVVALDVEEWRGWSGSVSGR